MHFKIIVLIVSLFGGSWAACPPAQDILPCTCDEEKLRFYCSQPRNATEPWDIKATFDQITPILDPDVIFDEILITSTKLQTVPAGAMQSIKFTKIYFEFNYDLVYIHPDAFGETVNVTNHLSIISNPSLANVGEGHSERDLFDVITKFKAANTILIHHNGIKSIPDEGFGPLPNLKTFRLGSGNLVRVGSRAFSGLPSLESAELGYCDISVNEIADDAFEGVGPNAEIRLEHNPFSRLPEVPFKPLLDNARLVAIGGQQCGWPFCYDLELDCDEESAWMCQDVEKYQPKVKGFFCRSESGYGNIWDYCAGEVNNKTINQIPN